MRKHNKEIHHEILKRFGTNKTHDEKFSERQYWESLPEDEEDGTKFEPQRANPDLMFTEDDTPWRRILTDEEELKLSSILEGFKELSPREKQVVKYYGYHGFTIEDTAKKLQLSIGTVAQHLSRAKEKLRAFHVIKNRDSNPLSGGN